MAAAIASQRHGTTGRISASRTLLEDRCPRLTWLDESELGIDHPRRISWVGEPCERSGRPPSRVPPPTGPRKSHNLRCAIPRLRPLPGGRYFLVTVWTMNGVVPP